ncbi:ewing's tumor-associated antigen 1 isoform X2 [Acomys russatus]|nr:ewing's tumor-associated antigen 1 isoform X2 [Acomys russatus]
MLGVWIGETAIPCTPSVAKEKSRAKISCAKLKTQNREKELMKLAEQFDRNMGELDVIQEQYGRGHHCMQATSEVGHVCDHTDSTRMESGDTVPEISRALMKKQVEGHAGISVAEEQDNNEKPFDQSVEADLNAIFDGSTQMCSGHLSQDLSGAFLNNSKTTFVKKISFIEEVVTTETLLAENLLSKTPVSPSPQVNTAAMLKSCVTPYAKMLDTSSKRLDELTWCDFEDDWENLLGNEPFLMENADMLEHTPSATAQGTARKAICTFIGKNDAVTSRANTNLDRRLRDSKMTLSLPSEAHNREPRSTRENRFSPYPGDESRKLPFTGSRVTSEKSVSNIVSKNEDDVAASNLTGVKEDGRGKCTFHVDASDKPGSHTRHPNKQKYGLSAKLPLKAPANAYCFDPVFLGKENSVCNTDQTHGSKSSSSLDDWNDPLLASEMVEACHQLETTWAADDMDDDLLCQACDDVERLTQQENRGSEESASLSNIPRHGSRNAPTAPTQGSVLVVPSNPVSSSTLSSLTNKSQINKSVTVRKRDNYPTILDATTNFSVCSKNSGGNQHVPLVQVNSPKFVLAGTSSLNVSLGPVRTGIATNVNLSTHPLSHSALANGTQNDSGVLKCSKFTFKTKNPQALSQLNQNCIAGSIPVSKILQDLGKEETVHSLLEGNHQRPSIKSSESLKPSSTDEEERNRKYSPEEIQRKRQEALVRRKAKAQAWPTVHPAPISLL